MQTVIVGNTLSYNIFIHLGRGINQDKLRHAIVSTLLYEMMLRTVDPEGLPDEVTLPPWLIAGLEQAVLWHTNEADRAMYSTLFQQSGIMTPEEILNCPEPEKELDATSYAAYQTSCGALVLCLLNQENGPEGMKQLLDQAILGNDDPRNLIKRHFPQLNLTPSSLHKWWTLQLSRMATPPLTETLTITETERHLQEALTLVKYDPDTRTTVTFPLDNLDPGQFPDGPEQAAFQHIRQPAQPQPALLPRLPARHCGIRQACGPDADRKNQRPGSRPENRAASGNQGAIHENRPARPGLHGLV